MKIKLDQAMGRFWDCDCIPTAYYTLHTSKITVSVLKLVIMLPKAHLIFKWAVYAH